MIASACDLCISEESMIEQGALPEPSAPTAPAKISSPSAAKNSTKSRKCGGVMETLDWQLRENGYFFMVRSVSGVVFCAPINDFQSVWILLSGL